MKRRLFLFLIALAAMVALAALRVEKKPGLLVLDWASRARMATPPTAVLIELGLKDPKVSRWSGRAMVRGARVVHREGYRFRDGDRLLEPDRWEASSHRPVVAPPRNPAGRLEPFATVGVILHIAEVQPDATLSLEVADREPAHFSLGEILAGHAQHLWDGRAVVRRVSTATPVVTTPTEDDFPAAAYGPDGTLWLAYISYTLKDERRRVRQEPLREQPANFKAFDRPEFGDQLFLKYYRDGKWSEPIAVTGPREDLVRCAVAAEGDGTVWVACSANRQGNHGLYVRPIRAKFSGEETKPPVLQPGPEQKLADTPASEIGPVLATDQNGDLVLACQCWNQTGGASVALFGCRTGKWNIRDTLVGFAENKQDINHLWHPTVSSAPIGAFALSCDEYARGDFDISVAIYQGNRFHFEPVATSSLFEARPSIAYDPQGRLWIAYEEGPEKWGLDYGALDDRDGNPLYNVRSVRVVCLVDGKLMKPAADLPTSVSPRRDPNEQTLRYAYPQIGIDGKGRVWLTYRQKFGTRYTTHIGSYWLTFARRLDGDHWSEPIEIHHSDGLLDSRPVLLPHPAGGLLVFHNTDGRYTSPNQVDNQIYQSYLDLPGDPAEPKLVPHQPGEKARESLRRAEQERAGVKAIRAYRVENDGKKYHLLRGDFHRHTEISWDGGPDGSLEDFFRYGIDVAAFDWIACTDHDNGGGREYTWWLTQKMTDAYHVPKAFTPVFAYERSVVYPHGHRNVMFARRGILTLPRLAQRDPQQRVAGIHADDTKMLYRYLRELGGICASHTSATGMGTDWRDNDPQVEPVVEIYQGDRNSYEYEDAPRAGHDPQGNRLPVSIGGWQPKGFINLALQKGYRLGFQSSSDHWSTHISYCTVLAEDPSREGIVDALKKRHCYAATDNIVLDVQSGRHLMGDEFRTDAAPTLQIVARGTGSLARIDILKDSEVVETLRPGRQEYRGTWTDPKPTAGRHYYYLRVLQEDEELAWSSPLWIEYAPP
jgi:hypothetical protein